MPKKDDLIFHPDFRDMVELLIAHKVEFVIVGAFALANIGFPRGTGDLDVWLKPTPENAQKVVRVLNDFGFTSLGIKPEDILSGEIIQLGFVPVRIDLITKITAVTNEELWNNRVIGKIGGLDVPFLSKDLFVRNKQAVGRRKDLADLESIGE